MFCVCGCFALLSVSLALSLCNEGVCVCVCLRVTRQRRSDRRDPLMSTRTDVHPHARASTHTHTHTYTDAAVDVSHAATNLFAADQSPQGLQSSGDAAGTESATTAPDDRMDVVGDKGNKSRDGVLVIDDGDSDRTSTRRRERPRVIDVVLVQALPYPGLNHDVTPSPAMARDWDPSPLPLGPVSPPQH